jgi:Fe-S cluster biosynthesis and repair protein YggX
LRVPQRASFFSLDPLVRLPVVYVAPSSFFALTFSRTSVCDNFKRKFMPERTVFCEKLKQQLPGLPEPPFDSALGQRIYEHVSQQAWNQWMEFCKMLLNEYRLNPARKQDQEVIVKQMEQFFFGEGAAPPQDYVPPAH